MLVDCKQFLTFIVHFPPTSANDRFMFKLIDRPLYQKMLLTTLMIFHLGAFCDHARRCQHLKYISIQPTNDRFMIKLIDRLSFLKKQHTVLHSFYMHIKENMSG